MPSVRPRRIVAATKDRSKKTPTFLTGRAGQLYLILSFITVNLQAMKQVSLLR